MTQKEIDKNLAEKRKLLAKLEKQLDASLDKEDKLAKLLDKASNASCDIDELIEEAQADIDDLTNEDADDDLVETGEIPSPEQAKRMKAQVFSYSVTFVRRKARKGKTVLHSVRRFSSRKEAEHHGKRFTKKHNHSEFSVCIMQQKANAWVNWKTGKTNPAL